MRSISMRLVGVGLAALLAVGCASNPNKQAELDAAAIEELTSKAVVQERRGDYTGALASYMAATQITPSADLWHQIGRMHLGLEDEMQAMTAFGNAVRMDAEHAPSLEAVGLIHLKWQQIALAEDDGVAGTAAHEGGWNTALFH